MTLNFIQCWPCVDTLRPYTMLTLYVETGGWPPWVQARTLGSEAGGQCGGVRGPQWQTHPWEVRQGSTRRIRRREKKTSFLFSLLMIKISLMSSSLSQKAMLHLLGDHRQVEGDWGAGPGWPSLQWNCSNGKLRVPGECHNFTYQHLKTLQNDDHLSIPLDITLTLCARWAAGRISTLGTTLKGTGSTPLGSWSTAPPGQCSFSSFKQRILPIKHIN